MKHRARLAGTLIAGLMASSPSYADVALGAFDFDSLEFGNVLIESDGGAYSANNWLNIVNLNPGNPGFLTGANFNTGIANIGLSATPLYTIRYTNAITNGTGSDLGIVTARYSVNDTIRMDVSTDGGTTWAGFQSFAPAAAVSSGVGCNYFYGGGGPFACNLFVTPVDLSIYGVGAGASINAVRISGGSELDLIRVAGFDNGSRVPLPGTLAMLGIGLCGLGLARRRSAQ